ncbi:MAG: hypothetical protein V4760_17790, partial [Bdellovibrionota bacterium]
IRLAVGIDAGQERNALVVHRDGGIALREEDGFGSDERAKGERLRLFSAAIEAVENSWAPLPFAQVATVVLAPSVRQTPLASAALKDLNQGLSSNQVASAR